MFNKNNFFNSLLLTLSVIFFGFSTVNSANSISSRTQTGTQKRVLNKSKTTTEVTRPTVKNTSKSGNINKKAVKEIVDEKHYNQVFSSDKPVVIMYTSDSCQPCKIMKPHFESVAKANPNISFYELNTSKSQFAKIIEKNKIMGLPTVTYSKRSKEYKRDRRGSMPKSEIEQGVKEFLTLIK